VFSYLYSIVENYFSKSLLMKLGFSIELRPRLLSLRRLIVSSDKCLGAHCAF